MSYTFSASLWNLFPCIIQFHSIVSSSISMFMRSITHAFLHKHGIVSKQVKSMHKEFTNSISGVTSRTHAQAGRTPSPTMANGPKVSHGWSFSYPRLVLSQNTKSYHLFITPIAIYILNLVFTNSFINRKFYSFHQFT